MSIVPKRGGRRAGAGRKTTYTPETARSLQVFFQERLDSLRSGSRSVACAPSLMEFSRTHGISVETMRKWATRHSEFVNAYGAARHLRGVALDLLRKR